MHSVISISHASNGQHIIDGRLRSFPRSRRARREPAHTAAQHRWLRSAGRARPLGHRRHRGTLWIPSCTACGKAGKSATHTKADGNIESNMSTPTSSTMHTVAAAAAAIVRSMGNTGLSVQAIASALEAELGLLLPKAFGRMAPSWCRQMPKRLQSRQKYGQERRQQICDASHGPLAEPLERRVNKKSIQIPIQLARLPMGQLSRACWTWLASYGNGELN